MFRESFCQCFGLLHLRVLLSSLSLASYLCVTERGPPKAFEVITITVPLPCSDMAAVPVKVLQNETDTVCLHQSNSSHAVWRTCHGCAEDDYTPVPLSTVVDSKIYSCPRLFGIRSLMFLKSTHTAQSVFVQTFRLNVATSVVSRICSSAL